MFHTTRRGLFAATAGGLAASALPFAPARAQEGPLTLAALRARGEIRIGCEAAFLPFTYREGTAIVGYDVDLAALYCQRLGVRPVFVDTAWAGVIGSLYAKRFDMIGGGMGYTRERMERVAFSLPYAEASQAVLVRANDRIASADDLAGRVVAVKLGSPGEIMHKRLEERIRAARGNGYREVRIFDDHPAAYLALGQRRVDAVFNTVPTLAMVQKSSPGRFNIVRVPGAENWTGLATRKEDVELVTYLNEELRRLKADGRIYELQEKWFGFRMELPDQLPTFS